MSEIISGDAGRIGFLIKGEYNPDSEYGFLDVVYYGGSSYVAKKETAGNPPAENNEFWQILARGGSESAAAEIMTLDRVGVGRPDGETISVDEDGTFRVINSGDDAGNFASKAIYGDSAISLGRKEGTETADASIAYGKDLDASGNGSFAIGLRCKSTGIRSVSFGTENESSGIGSLSSGQSNIAIGGVSSAIGLNNISYGDASFCLGNNLKSVDKYTFSEGCGNIAEGYGSHAEGAQNISGAKYVFKIASIDSASKKITFDSTYDGFSDSYTQLSKGSVLHVANEYYINTAYTFTVVSVSNGENYVTVNEDIPTSEFTARMATIVKSNSGYNGSHAEGIRTYAKNHSHAECEFTEAIGYCSHAEGYETKATNNQSHAEGNKSVASGAVSHAEGSMCVASGSCSHSGGLRTTASGYLSYAEGRDTTASGVCSHAEGVGTHAGNQQHVIGRYNDKTVATSNSGNVTVEGTSSHTAFCVGNGTSDAYSNAARIDYDGKLWCKQAYSSTGADYAEYFEWEDGNPDSEDRRGYFVTMNGEKIRKANENDWILGIISGNPCIIGNTDMEWQGQFMRDEFGSFIKEKHMKIVKEPSTDEDGNLIEVEKEIEVEFYKVNSDYDPDEPYTFRDDRPEWDMVGMMGVLPVRDDGTCQVNGFCRCSHGGIATASEYGYRVIKRVSENIVKVVFR